MSHINLPLILSLGVLITGAIWLLDALLLSRPRKRILKDVEARFKDVDVEDPQNRETYQQAKEQARKEPLLVEYSKSFFPVLLVVFVLRSFVAEPFQIPSGSMEPTLKVGDFILVNKFTYGIRIPVLRKKLISINEPKRGDVMVFFPPHAPDTYYIKRVIGLPGDKIEYTNNRLYINDKLAPQKLQALLPVGDPQFKLVQETVGKHHFTARKYLIPGRLSRHGVWRVPAGHYFMMGDNRDNSYDSRGWPDPFVPEDQIVGKAEFVWLHWKSFFSMPSFSSAGDIE